MRNRQTAFMQVDGHSGSEFGTYARAFGLSISTVSIPSRATEFTMMIRLASAAAIAALMSTAAMALMPDYTSKDVSAEYDS
jgi:hypothetical protein